jgi:hypothetical protein
MSHPLRPTPINHASFLLAWSLLFVLLTGVVITTLLGGLGLLPPHATRATASEWRGQSKVDVLLRVETDHEGGDVDDLLADAVKSLVLCSYRTTCNSIPDVALADEDTSVVDRFGETELVDAGLETALQEVLNF